MRDKRRKFLYYVTSFTGDFTCSLIIRDSRIWIEEGEKIHYEEYIPEYHLDKYDPSAKGGIPSIKIIPIVEFITLNITILPTSSFNEI